MISGDQNSGPHTCKASPSWTELELLTALLATVEAEALLGVFYRVLQDEATGFDKVVASYAKVLMSIFHAA